MAVKLTPLQELEGRIVLDEAREGWHVEQPGVAPALGDRVSVPEGSHEARVRATTTQLGAGSPQPALEVWVFDTGAGLRAVKTSEAKFVPA